MLSNQNLTVLLLTLAKCMKSAIVFFDIKRQSYIVPAIPLRAGFKAIYAESVILRWYG